jgi:DNA polymerase-3 subunit alpha
MGQTADPEEDVSRLRRVVDTLREFSGEDEISLRLNTDGKVTHARLTGVSTGYCPELRQRLEALVGEDGLKVE